MKVSELLMAVQAMNDYNSNQEVISFILTKEDVSSMLDPWDEFREPVPVSLIDATWDEVLDHFSRGGDPYNYIYELFYDVVQDSFSNQVGE